MTPKTTARVILWRACNRARPGCCNLHENGGIKSARLVESFSAITGFQGILITGGEPMLNPERVVDAIVRLRHLNPDAHVYVYTAYLQDTKGLQFVLAHADGLHVTVHDPVSEGDLRAFSRLQDLVLGPRCEGNAAFLPPRRSFRLHIDSTLQVSLPIKSCLWDRIENKPWGIDCPLPEHEVLFEMNPVVWWKQSQGLEGGEPSTWESAKRAVADLYK